MSCVPLPVFALDREILQDLSLDLAVLVEVPLGLFPEPSVLGVTQQRVVCVS